MWFLVMSRMHRRWAILSGYVGLYDVASDTRAELCNVSVVVCWQPVLLILSVQPQRFIQSQIHVRRCLLPIPGDRPRESFPPYVDRPRGCSHSCTMGFGRPPLNRRRIGRKEDLGSPYNTRRIRRVVVVVFPSGEVGLTLLDLVPAARMREGVDFS